MTDRSSFSLVVNDDLPHGFVEGIVEALDAGTYRFQVPRDARITDSGLIDVPLLVCDGGAHPALTFADPMWNCDEREDDVHPAFLSGPEADDATMAMARACLSAPWMPRGDRRRHHPVLLALAAVSAEGAERFHPAVGASAPSPWGEASSYQAASIIGGSVSPTPTNPDVAAFLPRLVSMAIVDRSVGLGPRIVLMPHGYRMPRSGLPDPIEILRILSNADAA